MKKTKKTMASALVIGAFLLVSGPASAIVGVGDTAPLFQSLDENMQVVDMQDMIQGKPLVLLVGSAS